MLPHTTSAVSAFPEDDVGRPTQFASKTGVRTTGRFLCSNVILLLVRSHAIRNRVTCSSSGSELIHFDYGSAAGLNLNPRSRTALRSR